MPMTTASLADKLAPRLQDILRDRQDEFVASAGGPFVREAVKLAFPTFVAEVPTLLRSAIDMIAVEFGHMDLNDLIAFLDSHAMRR